jgi:hypothetical protein
LLVGREEQRQEFLATLEDGPGSPGRATIYTGARGTGKTVLLNAIEEDARRLGWLVVSETATPGLVRRLSTEALPRLLAEQDPNATKSRMTGFTLPAALGGVIWDTSDVHQAVAGLRPQLTLLTKILAENETGLVITVDELHRRPLDELVELCAAVQHAFREELELAFVGAGLPAAVSDLLNEDVLTFLRRAERYHVGKVSRDDVRLALETPVEMAEGRSRPVRSTMRSMRPADTHSSSSWWDTASGVSGLPIDLSPSTMLRRASSKLGDDLARLSMTHR